MKSCNRQFLVACAINLLLSCVVAAAPTDSYLVFSEQSDGDVDYLEIDTSTELNLSDGSFTLSAWINPSGWGDNDQGRILDHAGGSGPPEGWSLHVENKGGSRVAQGLRMQINNDTSFVRISDPNILTLNVWQHVAVTLEDQTLTFYVNGIVAGVRNGVPTPNPSNAPVRIGARATDFARGFVGAIDEVRIWNRALSQFEIQMALNVELTGNEPGLVAYYRFNEALGQSADDSSLNNFVAQLGSSTVADSNDPEWQTSISANLPPVVDAGQDRTIVLPTSTVALDAEISDDDFPGNPSVTNWVVDSGPGTVTFLDAAAIDTTATFSDPGVYILRLTADDGEFSVADTLTVTFDAAPILSTIVVTPNFRVQLLGETVQFTAAGFDQAGSSIAIAPVWSATGGTIDGTGAYTAGGAPGTFAVQAVDGNVTGAATVLLVDSSQTWPTQGWETAIPVDMGMDEALLQQARDFALTGGGSGIITRSGKIVMSWGDLASRYALKSTTKSIGVTALGLAQQDGLLDIDDVAQLYLPGIGVPPDSNIGTGWLDDITLRHLATHTAGFQKPGGFIGLFFEPGTNWSYSDGGANWLADVLTVTYGMDLNDLLFTRVFSPLGIQPTDLFWRNNSYRPSTINGFIRREFGSGISANVDAMARIGYLYLRNGVWDGQAILPSSFINQAAQPEPSIAGLPVTNPVAHPNATDHYGLLWWNNGDGTLVDVPTDAYWSWGLKESLIIVIPSLDVVAVRAGSGWRSGWDSNYAVIDPFITPIAQSILSLTNQSPMVDAGADQVITLPSGASLNATVTDDGLPSGSPTLLWTQQSGPGTTTFADPNVEDTTANFDLEGVYALRLTADDGEFSDFDEVQITVDPAPPNQPPVVDAGADQVITLPSGASLDATVTDDGLPSGSPTLLWTQQSGPGTATFADPNAEDTTASFNLDGVYVLRLTADDSEFSDFDEVQITVGAAPPNQPPVVAAGADQAINLPSGASLDATVTDDGLPSGPPTLLWTQQSGPGTATFADPNAEDTTASFNLDGVYVLRLTADDSEFSDFDELTVTVTESARVTDQLQVLYTFDQSAGADVVDVSGVGAALDLTIEDPGNAIRTGDAGLLLNPATRVSNGVNNNKIYTAATASNELTVEAWIVPESVAQAGPARIVTLSLDKLERNFTIGQDNDRYQIRLRTTTNGDNGTNVRLFSAPGSATTVLTHVVLTRSAAGAATLYINGVAVDVATIAGDFSNWDPNYDFALGNEFDSSSTNTKRDWQGEYRLVAMYSKALSAAEVLQNYSAGTDGEPPPNQSPVVGAGPDQVITLPSGASLDATVTDDGLPSGSPTLLWTQQSGPGTATFADPNAEDTTASFNLDGVYVLRLTADDSEFSDFDEVQITVGAAPPNQPPVVAAGADQAINLPSGASLDATVTDDGLPSGPPTLLWTQQSGPGTATFADPNAEDTTASFNLDGVYVLRLTADDSEFSDFDELTVTVTESARVTDQLQVLYTFDQSAGADVVDVSGVGTALDLTIEDPGNAIRTGDAGLLLNPATRVSNGVNNNKIYTAATASNELTVEAWIVPESVAQAGPARIVTLSLDKLERNFTIGQDNDRYQMRLRTTTNGDNGTNVRLFSAPGSATTVLTHVVLTRSAAGAATLYINGVAVDVATIAGDFSNWDPNYDFALGNEFDSSSTNTKRDWQGEYRLVAMYSKALSAAEVLQNYSAGRDGEPPPNQPPLVAIDHPADESYVSRMLAVIPDITSSQAIDSIAISIDGQVVASASGTSNGVEWDSTSVSDGRYDLTVTVTDVIQQQDAATIQIHVDNATPNPPPYPYSDVITGIEWANPSTVRRAADQSDEWPNTWGDDDNMYTSYGDGWGFEPKVESKLSIGYARVVGGPDDFVGTNIRSATGERLVGNGRSGLKPSGMLMVDGRLYLGIRNVNRNGQQSQIAWSDDYATTWTFSNWIIPELGYLVFLNFGKNYAGARDNYVYFYSPNTPDAYYETDAVVLGRVPKDEITNRNAYEFVSGFDAQGNPLWSGDISQRVPVFDFPDGCNRLDVTYNAGLDRYFMVMRSRNKNGGLNQFSIFEAPEPWGPWQTVYYAEDYFGQSLGGIHDGWDVSGHLPSKWMSADGKDLNLLYSNFDNFAVLGLRLTTAPD